MSINFFELKYLITDCFYSEKTLNGYTYEQAAGICYESFAEYVNSDSPECITAISEIIGLKCRHKVQLTESDTWEIKKALRLYSTLCVKDVFTESELEYLEEDIAFLEELQSKLG
ncbi:MAG: hypothetical protein K2N06_00235 [Oscillospiraceae bacterium]|nr:hypothetical protein [Oscillospiraceae bacterium]